MANNNIGSLIPDPNVQFTDPFAKLTAYAQAYGDTLRAEEAAALDRAYRDQQAAIQQENWGKSFGLQAAADRRAAEQLALQKREFNRQVGIEDANNKLARKLLEFSPATEFKNTVSPDQTNVAKNAAITSTVLGAFDTQIGSIESKIKSLNPTKDAAAIKNLTSDLSKVKQSKNTFMPIAELRAKQAEADDLAPTDDPLYSKKVFDTLAASGADAKTIFDIAKSLRESKKAEVSEYDYWIKNKGIDITTPEGMKAKEGILRKEAYIPDEYKEDSGKSSILNVAKDVVTDNTKSGNKRWNTTETQRRVVTSNLPKLQEMAKKAYPEIDNNEVALKKFLKEVLAPELAKQSNDRDLNAFGSPATDAMDELEKRYGKGKGTNTESTNTTSSLGASPALGLIGLLNSMGN